MTGHRPQIGFGHVWHRRLRPAAHAFAYRSYFLRLPLRTLRTRPLDTKLLAYNRFALFSVHEADHGDGGPLLPWVESLLARAGVSGVDGEIWLHSFPRVLGYVFNPVSFWFCEGSDGSLRAVVCEVNNTFGERHCYILHHADGRAIAPGEELQAAKSLHVSPFCSVTGRYRFRFLLQAGVDAAPRFVARIDHDDDQGPLLLTSIEGRLEPLGERLLLKAFVSYPAFTLGVIARIHWQALRLWLKRVPFHHKPRTPARAWTTRA